MDISPGEEFRIKATPSPELLRRLAYLAEQDNGSVLTGGIKSANGSSRNSEGEKARRAADALRLARLADPAYQAFSQRINTELDLMDEASVHALQEIEQELAELQREREKMLAQAYRDEEGNAIFMAEDESAAYYDDGRQVDGEKFGRIKAQVRGTTKWDTLQDFSRRREALYAEREQVHAFQAKIDTDGGELREDLAKGNISKEEAEREKQEIEAAAPERVRHSLDALRGQGANVDDVATPGGSGLAVSQPAEASRAPAVSSLQPK